MWMIVLFDLPVRTRKERKAATDFRKALLRNGFSMSQFSVYYRLLSGKEAIESHVSEIRSYLPKSGKVDILCITDKQYENIVSFSGQSQRKSNKNPSQLFLF